MNAESFTQFGQRLYGRYGWQTELAEKLGVNRVTVWRYANGHAPIPESIILALEGLATRKAAT